MELHIIIVEEETHADTLLYYSLTPGDNGCRKYHHDSAISSDSACVSGVIVWSCDGEAQHQLLHRRPLPHYSVGLV